MENLIREKLNKMGITFTSNSRINFEKIKIIVPISGGKDSQLCLKLALLENDKESILALFCDTRFEHPETYAHITKITQGISLVTLNSGSVPEKITKYKRFPGGGARHCTDELKIRPAKFFYKFMQETKKEISGNPSKIEVWYGMRFGESGERAKRYQDKISKESYAPHEVLPSKYPKYLSKLNVEFRLPILELTDEDVFSALGDEVNILYSFGFDRVGCFPCLAGGEKSQKKSFDFDDFGKQQFETVIELAKICGRTVFRTKKLLHENPPCSVCSI